MTTSSHSSSLAAFVVPSLSTSSSSSVYSLLELAAAAAQQRRFLDISSSLTPPTFLAPSSRPSSSSWTLFAFPENDIKDADDPRDVIPTVTPPLLEDDEEDTENEIDDTSTNKRQPTTVPESKSLRRTLNLPPTPTTTLHTRSSRPLIIGHRGCLYQELENTRQGFLECARMGADGVEFDVFLLKYGTLVVFHGGGTDEYPGLLDDYCLNVPHNKPSILDLTYQEALQLQFNPYFEEFPCPKDKIRSAVIPTLEQVLLDAKRTGLICKIELKGPNTARPVLQLTKQLDMDPYQCHYSSFDLDQIRIIRELHPERDLFTNKHVYQTGALFNYAPVDYIQQALNVGASEIHLRYDECSIERIKQIHAAGFSSMAWFRGPIGMKNDVSQRYWDVGNETTDMYELLLETGVQQMCVNRPDVLINMMMGEVVERGVVSDDDEEEEVTTTAHV